MLQEIYLSSDTNFVLGEPIDQNEHWLLVKTYNELGHPDSWQLIRKDTVQKSISQSDYLDFYRHLITKQDSQLEVLAPKEADLTAFLQCCQERIIYLEWDNQESFYGKLNQVQGDYLNLSAFDWEDFIFYSHEIKSYQGITRLIVEIRDIFLTSYLDKKGD